MWPFHLKKKKKNPKQINDVYVIIISQKYSSFRKFIGLSVTRMWHHTVLSLFLSNHNAVFINVAADVSLFVLSTKYNRFIIFRTFPAALDLYRFVVIDDTLMSLFILCAYFCCSVIIYGMFVIWIFHRFISDSILSLEKKTPDWMHF